MNTLRRSPARRVRAAAVGAAVLLLAACGASRRAWVAADAASTDAPLEIGLWPAPTPRPAARAAFAAAKRAASLGRVADAVKSAVAAIDADPDYVEAHRLLQDLLARTTSDWWLHERYAKRLAERPDSADSWYFAARIEADPDRQIALFSEALARDPLHPYATLGRAIVMSRRGGAPQALEAVRRCTAAAPWLALPWVWLGSESLKHGDPTAARKCFVAARDRAPDEPRAWLGIAQSEEELGRSEAASAAALETLRLAPGDEAYAGAATDVLVRAAALPHLAAAVRIVEAAEKEGADPAAASLHAGRLLLAAGRPAEGEQALAQAVARGIAKEEVRAPLRLARVLAGRFKEAVVGAVADLPSEAREDRCLYGARWTRLESAARADLSKPRALLALAEAAMSVGWLEESRAILLAARAAAPDDELIAARAESEEAFGAFVDDLGLLARLAREGEKSGEGGFTVEDLLAAVGNLSRAKLGRDVSLGAVVRKYPMLGEFAASVASGGDFETTFGSHGLMCLVGARSGGGAELVLGRMVVVRAACCEDVLGSPLTADEIWLESEGLPADMAGLSKGLAGLTLDRLVLLQLDAICRPPRPSAQGLPFLARQAATLADRRSLETPSDVASRIEAKLVAEGHLCETLIDSVRRHELVHVYDAARLLPVGAHPFTALGFVLSHGFDGAATERALEGRAQALSMLAACEPRLALAALVGFLPAHEGETPHAAGYRLAAQLAVDLIIEDPASFPSIDQRFNVLQQLDRLTDAEVRELGRRVAEKL